WHRRALRGAGQGGAGDRQLDPADRAQPRRARRLCRAGHRAAGGQGRLGYLGSQPRDNPRPSALGGGWAGIAYSRPLELIIGAFMNDPELLRVLQSIADSLGRLAPPVAPRTDLSGADAFVWHPEGWLEPVAAVSRVHISLLRGIDQSKQIL